MHVTGQTSVNEGWYSRWLISGDNDGVVKVWEVSSGDLLRDISTNTSVDSLSYSQSLLVFGSGDGSIVLRDLNSPR